MHLRHAQGSPGGSLRALAWRQWMRARPSAAPRQRLPLIVPSGFGAGACSGEVLDEVHGFGRPPASYLQPKHCRTAASAGLEFRVGLGAFSARGLVECDAGFTGGSGAGFTVAVDGAHQGSVDCDLRAVPQRHSADEDFNRACVRGRTGEVHVPQEDVCTDTAPCFAAYPGHGAFQGDGPGAEESGGGTGGAMVSQRVKGTAATAAVVGEGEG